MSASENSPGVQEFAGDLDFCAQEFLFTDATAQDPDLTGSDKNEGTSSLGSYWENDLWSEVKQSITQHFYYNKLFPESFPQKFEYNHKEMLMQKYNLHPSKLIKSRLECKRKHHDSSSSLGHYEFTIMGINQNIAIDVSLPMYDNFSLFAINYVSNHFQSPGSRRTTETMDHHWVSLRDELVTYAKARERLHVICILDICHLGESKVEVCLNRVYYPVTESVAVT